MRLAPSHASVISKFVAVDIIGSFAFFPVWWYGPGLVGAARFCARTVRNAAADMGILVWARNLFVPMFGQRDIQSRIISFFMRLAVILYDLIVLILLSAVMTAVFAAWLAVPVLITYGIATQLAMAARIVPV